MTRQTRQSRRKSEDKVQQEPNKTSTDESKGGEVEVVSQKTGTQTSRTTRGSKAKQGNDNLGKPTKDSVSEEVEATENATKTVDENPPARGRATRSSNAKKQDDSEGEPADQKPAARRTRSRQRSNNDATADSGPKTTTTTTVAASAPEGRKTRASSRGRVTEASDKTTKRAASKGRGKSAAVDSEPAVTSRGRTAAKAPAANDKEDTKRPTRRSTSQSAANGKAAKSAAATKNGKATAASKNGSLKREREDEEPKQSRKSSRVSRAQSSAALSTRPKFPPCPDFLKPDDFRLFRGNLEGVEFDASKFTRGIAPVDMPNKENVLEVPEYISDIMQRLFDREVATRPHPYMSEQPSLNTNMRSILIDWLVEVHMKFRLEQCTLYLAVNIIDRYLERTVIERCRLQLVGVTAMLIACKVEEIYPPEVRDCVYICDRAYSRQEVLQMEAAILLTLEYRLSVPTGLPFLHRFLSITRATKLQQCAANYYMERMLQEYTALKHRPSLMAASCVVLALNNKSIRRKEGLTGPQPGVPKVLLDYTGFDFAKILDVCDKICGKVQNTQVTNSRRELISVKRKYEATRYMYIAANFDEPSVEDILSAHTS